MTGKIFFDGFRKDFALEALELTAGGLLPIGTWNISEGYTIHRSYSLYDFEVSVLPEDDDLRHTHFTIIICLVKNCLCIGQFVGYLFCRQNLTLC